MQVTDSTWRMTDAMAARFENYATYGRARAFRRGESLYRQGDVGQGFFYIRRGAVRVFMTRPDGSEVALETMGPGTVCGEGAAIDGRPRFSSAVAARPSAAVEFNLAGAASIIENDAQFALDLMTIVALKQRVLASKLEHFASRVPEDRVMELLWRLASMFGEQIREGTMIHTRLTHEQIGALTGNSRVTVTRTLNRLRQQGRIGYSEGRICLRHTPPTPKTAAAGALPPGR